jgi:hypothetical protein
VVLDVETQDDGSSRCLSVQVEAPPVEGSDQPFDPVSPGVTTDALRKIPVARFIREARKSRLLVMSPEGVSDLSEVAGPEDTYGVGKRSIKRGKPLTDQHLEAVAEQYRAAVKAGRPPTETIRKLAGVGRPTAAKWIRAARDRGFLGAAIPGKAGEAK